MRSSRLDYNHVRPHSSLGYLALVTLLEGRGSGRQRRPPPRLSRPLKRGRFRVDLSFSVLRTWGAGHPTAAEVVAAFFERSGYPNVDPM